MDNIEQTQNIIGWSLLAFGFSFFATLVYLGV